MAKRVVWQLSFVITLILAACGGGGGDSPANVSATSAASVPSSPATNAPPAAPSANPPASQPATSVTLDWNANTDSDLAGYRIYRATSSGAYGPPIAIAAASATSYVVSGLQPGVTYFFVITAFDTAGNESARSAEVSATVM